jgi:hypothetical protein
MLGRVLLVAAILLSQAASAAQSDLETRVAQQVERIKSLSGSSESGYFELPHTGSAIWNAATGSDGGPVAKLISYGMDAIPDLAPHLADTSLTKAYRRHSSGMVRQVAVSEYIIHIINTIADHSFAESGDSIPDVGALQSKILSWWRENRSKSLLQRKIDDVNDPNHTNRFSADAWLGGARAGEGRLVLEQRIEALLKGEVNTLKQSEMVACADSLARIGERDSAPVVRKVCDHLNYWVGMSYRPIEEGRSGHGSEQITELFKAYHALALLGFRKEALSALRELGAKYLTEMEPSAQREFLRNLEGAEQW